MDNSQNEKLKVYISGYGPFMDITENPSNTLVDHIMMNKSKYEKELDNFCEIAHKEIYEVSVDYVSENVKKCHALIDDGLRCEEKGLHLLVHFGVSSKSDCINLEVVAKNEIHDYISPRCRINEEGEDLYLCKLDLEMISKELCSLGHNVKTSTDAGTYLCNFIYYKSSEKFCNCENVIPLFIHIPLPQICSAEQISKCFLEFLKIVLRNYLKF